MFSLVRKIGSGIKKGLGAVAGVGAKVIRVLDDKNIVAQTSDAGVSISIKPPRQTLDVPVTEARAFPSLPNWLPYILIGIAGWFVIKKIK